MTVAIEPFAEHLTQAEEVKVKELAAAVAHHVQVRSEPAP